MELGRVARDGERSENLSHSGKDREWGDLQRRECGQKTKEGKGSILADTRWRKSCGGDDIGAICKERRRSIGCEQKRELQEMVPREGQQDER